MDMKKAVISLIILKKIAVFVLLNFLILVND